jgi:hypothetical protein
MKTSPTDTEKTLPEVWWNAPEDDTHRYAVAGAKIGAIVAGLPLGMVAFWQTRELVLQGGPVLLSTNVPVLDGLFLGGLGAAVGGLLGALAGVGLGILRQWRHHR